MALFGDDDGKTEKPTPSRLQEVREKGDSPLSRELVPQQQTVQGPNYLQAAQLGYQGNLNNYNAQQAQQGNLMGGLFSAAAVGGRRFTLVAGSQVLEHVPEPQRRRRARARTARAAAVAGGPAMGTVEAFDHPNDPDGAWLRVVARNPVGDG